MAARAQTNTSSTTAEPEGEHPGPDVQEVFRHLHVPLHELLALGGWGRWPGHSGILRPRRAQADRGAGRVRVAGGAPRGEHQQVVLDPRVMEDGGIHIHSRAYASPAPRLDTHACSSQSACPWGVCTSSRGCMYRQAYSCVMATLIQELRRMDVEEQFVRMARYSAVKSGRQISVSAVGQS